MAPLLNPARGLRLSAPAKVNLSLRVTGRREDGYHELDTVMQKLDLADQINLSLTDRPGVVLRCPDSDLPEDRSNIAYRAAEVMLAAVSSGNVGVDIVLQKQIPLAAGLGGGSSDAGAVLVGLNSLLRAGLSERELIDLATPLGADVPFFVTGYGAVRAQGIGEKMCPVPSLRGCTLLLVNPGFSVSTRWVFGKFALTMSEKKSKLAPFQKMSDHFYSGCGENDLEKVTLASYPQLDRMKRELLDFGAVFALMSGSGPTLFGIFPDRDGEVSPEVRQAAHFLQKRSDVKIFVTRPV